MKIYSNAHGTAKKEEELERSPTKTKIFKFMSNFRSAFTAAVGLKICVGI